MAAPLPTYNNVSLTAGENISYIEAGSHTHPTLLLLHGFPSSTSQFRNLIPLLSDTYHVIAPDLPGFGTTTVPSNYTFTFDNLTTTIGAFLKALEISSYAVYIFDYGAPIALRLALKDPKPIKAIISQNGNAYDEGFGHPFWDPIEALWANNSSENRETLRTGVLNLAVTQYQYTAGVPEKDLPLIDPVTYNYDYLKNLRTPEQQEIQLALFYDYRTNKQLYPTFQKYFRESQVPLLAVWGKGDPAFIYPGAEAFKRDLPKAKVVLLDGGHFLLETKVREVADEVKGFLKGVSL